jgi:hypothetical protein
MQINAANMCHSASHVSLHMYVVQAVPCSLFVIDQTLCRQLNWDAQMLVVVLGNVQGLSVHCSPPQHGNDHPVAARHS